MRVLGIDPGLRLTGYACLEVHAADPTRRPSIVEAGVFRFAQGRTVADRLAELAQDLQGLLARTEPELATVEALFAHYAHPRTAITMGHARGVILLGLHQASIRTIEVAPKQAKKSLTGSGRASKEQVQSAVQILLDLPEPPEPADVADAIAIALTGARRHAIDSIAPSAVS